MLCGCLWGRMSQSLSVCRLSHCQRHHSSDRWRAARGPFLLRREGGERVVKRVWTGLANHYQMKRENARDGPDQTLPPNTPPLWSSAPCVGNEVKAHLYWNLLINTIQALETKPLWMYALNRCWLQGWIWADIFSSFIQFSSQLWAAIGPCLVPTRKKAH